MDYRHWDTYNDGTHNHVFYKDIATGKEIDIMPNEPLTLLKTSRGDEDYIWSPDGSKIIYVCKKLAGTAYAKSTNTDLYEYDLASGKTVNLTP